MPTFTPVDDDPFAQGAPAPARSAAPTLTPIDHDPFEPQTDYTDKRDFFEQQGSDKNNSLPMRALMKTAGVMQPYLEDPKTGLTTAQKVEDVAKGVGSGVAQGAVGTVTGLHDIVAQPAEYLATKAANAITGRNDPVQDKMWTGDAFHKLGIDYQPKTAIGNDTQLASSFLGPKALQTTLKGVVAVPTKLAEYWNKVPFDPMKTMQGISDAYDTALEHANAYYALPKHLAQDQMVYAPEVKNHLEKVLADVESDPIHEARTQKGTLQRISDSLDDSGYVPANDLIDLRKFTNGFFNPKRMTDKSSVYGKLNNAVDSGLDTAKDQIPLFGKALDAADDYWANNVKESFLNNKPLNRVWTPDDALRIRQANEGFLDPDTLAKSETAQKAALLSNKVGDAPTYKAIRSTLDPDAGAAFDAEMLRLYPAPMSPKNGLRVISQLLRKNPSGVARAGSDYLGLATGPEKKAIRTAILDKDYVPLSDKNDVAQAAYENLVRAHMTGEANPLGLPEPPIYAGDGSPPPMKQIGVQRVNPDASYDDMRRWGRILPSAEARPDFVVDKQGFVDQPPSASVEPLSGERADIIQAQKDSAAREAMAPRNRPRLALPDYSGSIAMPPDPLRYTPEGNPVPQLEHRPNGPVARDAVVNPAEPGQTGYRHSFSPYRDLQADEMAAPKSPAVQTLENIANEPKSEKRGGRNFAQGGGVHKDSHAAGQNVNTEPTPLQKASGNYAKGHANIGGLPITIENPKGSLRRGEGTDGKKWSVRMPVDYGYIKRTVGADGEHVDVFAGPHKDSKHAFVVDQVDHKSGKFDEHKVLLGFRNDREAKRAYVASFSDGKGEKRIGKMTHVHVDDLKNWLKNGDTRKPAA